MRSQAYTYGVRRKPRFAWGKVALSLVALAMVAGVSAYFVPKTQAYTTVKQLYQAALGKNHQQEVLQMERQDTAVSAETISDAQKPTVQIVSPLTRQALSGDVALQVQASDNIKVAKVEFYIDGSLAGTDEAEPYEYKWATSGESNGRHTVMAKAYDATGNSEQTPLTYTTANKPKDAVVPTVNLTAPGNGSLVKGVTTLKATAYDASGIAKVEFYLGTTLLGSDEKAPYAYDWDASSLSGVQKLTARAYDTTGNVNTSSIVTVLVDAGPADTIKPTVVLTSSAMTPGSLTDTITLNAEASDDTGVAKVEFYRDNTLLFTDVKAPYTYAWDTLSVENGPYKLTVKAYDTSGNVQTSRALNLTANNPKDRKPPVTFAVPNTDSPNVQSVVSLYGDCVDKLVGKPVATPPALSQLQVITGFEFTSTCARGGKSATVSVDLGREVTNRNGLMVMKVRADGTVADITLSSTIDTRKSNGAPHTFVTYSVIDGATNDQDGVVNGTLVDPVFIGEEIQLKEIEQPAVSKPIVPVEPVVQPKQPESVRLIDAMHVREYVPYGVGVCILGVVVFALRPRRSYRLRG